MNDTTNYPEGFPAAERVPEYSCGDQTAIPTAPKANLAQWYVDQPELYRAEVKAMRREYPDARLGFLENSGDMYWLLERKIGDTPWRFLLRCLAADASGWNRATTIHVIPLAPSVKELRARAKAAGRPGVPHLVAAREQNKTPYIYLSLFDGSRRGVDSAVSAAALALRWAANFEYGLENDDIWNKWCDNEHFRDWKISDLAASEPEPNSRLEETI